MQIRVLNEKDIKKVMDMKAAIGATKDALKAYSNGGTDIPLRANLDVADHNGQSLYMYGYVPSENALGVKIVSVYPDNIAKNLTSVPATMVTLNNETGEVNSLIDGTYLTRLRTGAIAGAATDELANKDSKIFALFGTGGQAETQLETILNVRDIKEVRVFDLSKDRAEDFAKRMKEKLGNSFDFEIKAVDSADQAIENADIITTVTTAKDPVFDGTKVKKSCHINGVGSYTPEMSEIPEYIISHADKIYVDTFDGAVSESGDFIKPIKNGSFDADKDITGELGEKLLGKISGRENTEEITFFETTGSAVLDLVVGQKILEAAEKENIGQIIEM
ncbi:ornithine cyclodeaminase family protein [uncultured Anaerococcus sp.]|uniref:ornithine cyclodeaminase family protein n=1 Tax=uncultured Anaerococcus sp. TaxID=293428 RepID=UPI00261B34FD|nr:ornithine cyclodeaminase family protein [uncultured Anaerococcus sp.]